MQSRWLRYFQLGRLEEAHAEARAAVDTADDFGYTAHRSRGLAILAETWLHQGKSGMARTALTGSGRDAQKRASPVRREAVGKGPAHGTSPTAHPTARRIRRAPWRNGPAASPPCRRGVSFGVRDVGCCQSHPCVEDLSFSVVMFS